MAAKEFIKWFTEKYPHKCIDGPEASAAIAAWNHVEEKFTSTNQETPNCPYCKDIYDVSKFWVCERCGERW